MVKIYRPGQCIDHYEIIQLLGRGPASSVYHARDLYNQLEVVLKFPHDDELGGRTVYEHFKREELIGALLHDSTIQCRLYPGEEHTGNYLVLEYLHGRTLRQVMQKQAPDLLPFVETLRILTCVCQALTYVHEQGIIHRDIKPENIMLLDGDAGGVDVKILDFGLAQPIKRPREIWPRTTPLVGTPDYMSPELLAGQHASVQSDVYAVGIVLYELLCGRIPFAEHDAFSFVSPHISFDPPDILTYKPDLPVNLATIVMRTIRRDADKRYPTIQALQHDLTFPDAVSVQPYVPESPRVGGQYRQIIGIVLTIVCICLLLVAFGFFVQFFHHTSH